MESIDTGKLIFAGVGLVLLIAFVVWALWRNRRATDKSDQHPPGDTGGYGGAP
ncbi:MAG: hypothetical protein AAFN17_12425 [Pseudomonadota bacterium]